jgi:hypothetical protein
MNEAGLSPMSMDPPQWSPLTEPPGDDRAVTGDSLDQRQAEDWIDWMKWDEKDVQDDGSSLTPRLQPQMLTPDTQESEKMSSGSSSPRRSSSVPDLSSALTNHSANLITPTSTSTAFSIPSPRPSESRTSLESMPRAVKTPGIPSTPPVFSLSNGSKPSRKRKSPAEDVSAVASTPPESKMARGAKRPHNMVERRYRNNLNEKIAALRDSVPSLRIKKAPPPNTDEAEGGNEDEDSSQKLNKGSILAKATEYISHLELRARRLDEENVALKTRLRNLEKLLQQKDMNTTPADPVKSSGKTDQKITEEQTTGTASAVADRPSSPKGLIPVPESFRRLRMTSTQPHYAESYIRDQSHDGEDVKEGKPHGKFMNRLMIGSLAGLMVMDSFMTKRENGERSNIQGLLAIPVDLISTLGSFLHLSRASSLFPLGHLHAGLLPVVRFFLALNILAFLAFVYLFSSKPMGTGKDHSPTTFGAALSLSSPIHIRRQAWLTSIQTIWVPRHTILFEFIATTLEALKYFVRYLVGWPIYSWLTGRTEDYEIARRKALDILIDSQLAGGDPEISRSRLVLTIFASGTLPNTAGRLMVKALHARIILWRVGRPGSLTCRLADAAANKVARYQWGLAQRLAKSHPEEADFYDGHDALPPYLVNLLRYSCDEALNDSIIQRAYNLAWVRPFSEGIDKEDCSMNAVAEDTAVRGPLDAIAAWWSTSLLNNALSESIADGVDDRSLIKLLEDAQKTAPTSSVAQIRAQAAKAIFVKSERNSSINHLVDALPPYKSAYIKLQSSPYVPATTFFTTEMPIMARDEVRHAANCAILMALLETASNTPIHDDLQPLLQKSLLQHKDFTPLSFVAARQLLRTVQTSTVLASPKWEAQIQSSLRVWASDEAARSTGDVQAALRKVSDGYGDGKDDADTKRIVSRRWSNDTGYETQ